MLKTISERLFMTGTSKGSLYPVVMRHPDTGLHLGARIEVGKTNESGLFVITIYARLQQFKGGEAVPMSTVDLFKAVPNSQFRVASPLHLSGPLGQGAFKVQPGWSDKQAAEECGAGFVKVMKAICAGVFKSMELSPDEHLKDAASDRYLAMTKGVAEEADIENQLNSGVASDSLDLGSILAKLGPLAKPE